MIVARFLSVGTVTGFVVMVFLLTVCGILVCHADFKYSLLYAALATEIMLLCYGIVKSLIGLLYAWLPYFFYDMAGIAAMLASEAASLFLTGVCYYMVYRYFPGMFFIQGMQRIPFIPHRKCSKCFWFSFQS